MQISKISAQPNFGKLILDINQEKLKSKAFNKKLNEIKTVIRENKFDNKRYADVILEHDQFGFFGVVANKKGHIPMEPNYMHYISTDKKEIANFKKWLNTWNHAFAAKK